MKLQTGGGGVWRLPQSGMVANGAPATVHDSVAGTEGRDYVFFRRWAVVLCRNCARGSCCDGWKLVLQMYVQTRWLEGFENRGTILRLYHGFRGGDRPKNAEREFPDVCVTPRGNFEPWMLFRKPFSERTVAENLRKWDTGGLRMLEGGKPLPDAIPSFKTPSKEREIADHPSLKPQHFLRILVRSLLPFGRGVVLDPFMGSGSTIAAAMAIGYDASGIEIDPTFYALAKKASAPLSALYPGMNGATLEYCGANGTSEEYKEQLMLLEARGRYSA